MRNKIGNDLKSTETMDSTLTQHAIKSGAAWLASADAQTRDRFLNELSEGELLALPYLFEFWAHPHQLPPDGDWRSWVILGGRGAGKTRAGAEWVRAQVEGARPLTKGRAKRVALVAETLDQARDVMIFGDSGIMERSPPDRRLKWEATKKRLIWPNGATATIYSAHDPESLRGPQFDAAWVDALAQLVRDVRAILGPQVKLGYAADWREYGAYVPSDAPEDMYFPLDTLWAEPAINFVGVNARIPLAERNDEAACFDVLTQAHIADKYLKKFQRTHPRFGVGSIYSTLFHTSAPLAGLTWISEPETLAAFERALGVIARFKSELHHMNT